jgi:hypothetical protein
MLMPLFGRAPPLFSHFDFTPVFAIDNAIRWSASYATALMLSCCLMPERWRCQKSARLKHAAFISWLRQIADASAEKIAYAAYYAIS